MRKDVLVAYKPGPYREEAIQFFRKCIGEEMYKEVMAGGGGRLQHAMAARVFLPQSEWEQFCLIEQYGPPGGFSGDKNEGDRKPDGG